MSNQVDLYSSTNNFYPFRVGNFECAAVCDGSSDYSLESMVTNAPRSEVEAYLRAQGLPTEVITTPYTYPYVDTGSHKIMVDMGAGKLLSTTGKLLENMEQADISPQLIDQIFISHAHPDHIGGALNDKGEFNFPNATYFIWKKEWEFWFSEQAIQQADEFFVTFAQEKLAPLKERTILIEEENEILPGVEVIFAPGHTPGHMAISFKSEGEQFIYTADTALHPLHLERPDWFPVFDILPDSARASKNHIFDLAATTNSLVLGQHFPPFPNVGRIIRKEIGWKFLPIETEPRREH